MLKIELKFHAIDKISEHVDLMKYEDFLVFKKKMSVLIQYSNFIFYEIQFYSVWFTFWWTYSLNICIYQYN